MPFLAMLFVVGTLGMIWVVVPLWISSQRKRIDELERRRLEEGERRHDVTALTNRVAKLEATVRELQANPQAAPATTTITPQTVAPAAVALVSAPKPVAASGAGAAITAPAPKTAPVFVPAPAPPVGPVPPLEPESATPEPNKVAASEVTDPEGSSAWEIVVGANWLNRIGVVAIVIGIALAVGYTVGHTGPLGRVTIGYAMSLLLLGAGVWLERHPTYRSYAYGLVAGGWAGAYFTTYAMHALEAARVVDSNIVATLALILVAGGMVVHSLRYRSQTVTGLAYLIAYGTLTLTPLSGFALVASVPLSASLLFTAQLFGWPQMSTLGIVATYGLFVLRGSTASEQLTPGSFTPFLTLAAYWLTFEIGDIAAVRGRRADAARPAPLFALNAVGFLGASLLQLPANDPVWFSNIMAGAAAAYLIAALLRARLLGPAGTATAIDQVFLGTAQGAIAISAGFGMWAMGLRFSGSREVVALLLIAELLFVAGITFGDRLVRGFGAAAAAIVAVRALNLVSESASHFDWPFPMHVWTPAVVVVALAFYVNREVVRTRQIAPLAIESGYTPAASILVLQVLFAEVPAPYVGLSLIAAAYLLVEAGLRRAAEYRYQAYVVGVFGFAVVLDRYLGDGAGRDADHLVAEAWRVLPAIALLAYACAARLAGRMRAVPQMPDAVYGAAAAACLGTGIVVLFEWQVASPVRIAPYWAATALMLVVAGAWRRLPLFVWQGYLLVLVSGMRGMMPIVLWEPERVQAGEIIAAGVVAGVLFTAGVVGRRSLVGRSDAGAEIEDALRIVTLIAGSAAVVFLIFQEMRPSSITLALGLAAVLLVAAGVPLGERVLRLSGLAVFAIAILRLFANDLVQLEGLTRIVSFIVSGMVLLGVSWTYTRFRDQIRKYL